MGKVKLKPVRPNVYQLVYDAIEGGMRGGINKFLKWSDNIDMTDDQIELLVQTQLNYVSCDLDEVVDWDKSG